MVRGYILVVHHVGAEARAENLVKRDRGHRLIHQKRHAQNISDFVTAEDTQDIAERFGTNCIPRSGAGLLEAKVPIAELRVAPVVTKADRKDVAAALQNPLDETPVPWRSLISFVVMTTSTGAWVA